MLIFFLTKLETILWEGFFELFEASNLSISARKHFSASDMEFFKSRKKKNQKFFF